MGLNLQYNEYKNQILKTSRGVDFQDVIKAIKEGNIIDDINHFNPNQYPDQRILIININDYIYAVPYIKNHKTNTLFLTTIYPSRKLTKEYLKWITTKNPPTKSP